MKQKTSFLTRCIAFALVVVLLATCTNLGAALRVSAVDSETTVTAGELVANNYELTESEKALLKSGYLVGDTYSYAVPSDSALVTVDTEKKEIKADGFQNWVATKAAIVVGSETKEEINIVDGVGKYTYTGNMFSVEVTYKLTQVVPEAMQNTLLNAGAYLKQGVANATSIYEGADANLGVVVTAMDTMKQLAEGINLGWATAQFGDAAIAAVNSMNAEINGNGGSLKLQTANSKIAVSSKVKFLVENGISFKADVINTYQNLKAIRDDELTNNSLVDAYLKNNAPADYTKWAALKSIIKSLVETLEPVATDNWDMLTTKVLKDGLTDANYAALDALVAALGTASTVTVKNPLDVATATVKANVSMKNVQYKLTLKVVEDKADSETLVDKDTATNTLTMPEGTLLHDIRAAIEADEGYVEFMKNCDKDHFDITTSDLPEELSEDIEYIVTVTPKNYTVTLDYAEDMTVPYGYQMTLPKHTDPAKAYDYTVDGEYFAQESVVTITGETTINRTEGKAYSVTDLYTVVANNFGNDIAQNILKSGALKGNQVISVRKPDPADVGSLLELKDGKLTVLNSAYPSDYKNLKWAPYTYGATGDETKFDSNSVSWSEKEVKAKYILNLTNVETDEVARILDLAKTLKTDANAQIATLDRLANYYDTMGGLDRTKLGALNGVIDVTDFTPDDGTEEDAENLEMRAYMKGVVSNIIKNSLDTNSKLKIYNMLGSYKAENGGLRYYYNNSEAVINEIDTLSGYMTSLLADEQKKAALTVMVEKAGYPEYVEKIEKLESVLEEVKGDLTAPNEAIDLASANLGKLADALEAVGTVDTKTAATPYLVSDALTVLDESQVNVQVIITIGDFTQTVTTPSFDKGHVLTEAEINTLKSKIDDIVAGQIDAKFYDLSVNGDALDTLVGKTVNDKINVYYEYTAKQYTVKIDGEENQIVTVEKPEIILPKHGTEGWFYRYTIGSKTDITAATYKFSKEELSTLFTDGKLTITRTEVNEAADKLESTIEDLNNNAAPGNSYDLVKNESGVITGMVANVSGSKNGLMSFATDLVNIGYAYIGINGEGFLYLNDDNSLEISLQTMIDAMLNDSTFGSQTFIDLGNNNGGKVLSGKMQLGSDAGNLDFSNLNFELKMTSVPAKMKTVSKGLNAIKNYMTFNADNGVMNIEVNMTGKMEKVYEAYLTALLATGTVQKDDMNAINSEIAYQFLYDYIDLVVSNKDVTTTTFSNTLSKLGYDRDLTGYEEYYQLVRKAMTNEGFTVNTDVEGWDINVEAKGSAALALIESLGFDLSSYTTELAMVKEFKGDNALHASAVASLKNTEVDYEAALIDVRAAGKLNKFDYTTDLVARSAAIVNQAAIILLDDVTGDLTFNGTTILDLNGHTINGDIVSNKALYIFDSKMGTADCGGVTGNISGTVSIIGGKYSSDVSAFLKDGYVQVGGVVQNSMYTIESNSSARSVENLTFVLNTNVVGDGYPLNVKAIAADIATDLVLNYVTTASLAVDGNKICAVNFNDLIGLLESDSTRFGLATQALACFDAAGTSAFLNEVIADLLDFAAIKNAINSNSAVASYTLTTAPWAVEIQHITEGDYLSVGVVANDAKAKDVNVSLKLDGSNKNKIAKLVGALADIVVAENTYATIDLEQPTYSNKTLYLSGTAEGCVDINLAANKEYQTVLAVILAYGNPAKADALVNAIGSSARLEAVFNSMTVREVFDALKRMSRGVSFTQMAASLGVTGVEDAAELESVFHKILCGAGKVLEKFEIDGYTDKTMGQLKRSCGRYVLEVSPARTADITRRGYTVNGEAVVEKATLAVSIFGTGLLGDADSDGDVDNIDAMLIAQYYVGILTADDLNLCVCDVDGNGVVDNLDAMLVSQHYVGIITTFPAE